MGIETPPKRCDTGDIEPLLAAPAQVVERNRREGAEQGEPRQHRINERHHLVAEREPEQDEPEDGIDDAEEDSMRRYRVEILDALGNRVSQARQSDRVYGRFAGGPEAARLRRSSTPGRGKSASAYPTIFGLTMAIPPELASERRQRQ